MSSNYDHGGNIFSLSRQMGISVDQLIDFSASINPLGMSKLVKNSLIAALDNLVHYPDNSHLQLKEALASYHGLSPENFYIANGSTDIIYQLPTILKGSKALIISPAFSEYARSLSLHNWETQHFLLSATNDFALDTSALELSLAEGFDALYLCNPGNPSGSLHSQEVIEKVNNLCRTSGTFFVLDEAFMDFCEEGSAKTGIITGNHGLILRSMTKFFAIPGLRLGYAIASASLVKRLETCSTPWGVNTLAQIAGEAALKDEVHNRLSLEFVDQERNYLFEKLSSFSQMKVYPSKANYLLAEIKAGITAHKLKERLMEQRIIIRDCSSFQGLSPYFFRIAIRTRQENERLMAGLSNVLTEIN